MKKAIVGLDDLYTLRPDLAAEWDYKRNGGLNPWDVVTDSSQKVWWVCKSGHEWMATVANRVKYNKSGCPYCAINSRNVMVSTGVSDLVTVNPAVASEWHPTKNGSLKPWDVTAGSNMKVWWLGKCGHEWMAIVANRVNRHSGCPYCANQKVLTGFNDLATLSPKVASEWHPVKNGNLRACDVLAGTSKRVWWRCSYGHDWEAAINNRTKLGSGCPYCSRIRKNRMVHENNNIAITKPELAREWHPTKNGSLKPSDVANGSKKKVWWLCRRCGYEWQAAVHNRVTHGVGCPNCKTGKFHIMEERGGSVWVNEYPEIAAMWHPTKNGGMRPCDAGVRDKQYVWWKGACGHEWHATVNMMLRGARCPICPPSGDGRKRVLCVETGVIYASIAEAAGKTGLQPVCISLCCKGKQGTSGGYHWKFV